jgi:putative DNA methylase
MEHPVKLPKKLIEVALPLDAINAACAYEKMPGIGAHPRGIHLWWARRPLAAARAVIFAQLVNDPGYQQGNGFKYGKNKRDAAVERKRLFNIIEELVKWENSDNQIVLEQARAEILRSWKEVCELNKDHPKAEELFNPDKLPAFHDPFAGGGTIPLEAQRLGLESYASDLNPVAVLINKSVIEIPYIFADRTPVAPISTNSKIGLKLDVSQTWMGTAGLAEDVRRYGAKLSAIALEQIGHLYPPVEITSQMATERPDLKSLTGQKLKAIAWLWTRTVKSPNPAYAHVDVPLISSFMLSNKDGKEAYVDPVVNGDSYQFTVKIGPPPLNLMNGTKAAGKGAEFRCLVSGSPISAAYIRNEGRNGRIGQKLMAIVVEGSRGRIYLPPTEEAELVAVSVEPSWKPDLEFFQDALGFRIGNYGLSRWGDLFTARQLTALNVLSNLVVDIRKDIVNDGLNKGMTDDQIGIEAGGKGITAYAEAISLYLAFAVDRCADFSNAVTRWVPGNQKVMNLFGKQTIPMTWDFPEAAILSDGVGGFISAVNYIADCIDQLFPFTEGHALQADAQNQTISYQKFISTDPPYYDNIGYADLSDFFYVWLRRSLKKVFPNTFATMAVPKLEELVATPIRHGTKQDAEKFFLNGMTKVLENLFLNAHPGSPITIYYAFKQSQTTGDIQTSSTGWETFLTAILDSGFAIVGTWPLRSEQEFRMRGLNSNALASSIVLVCRRRDLNAATVSRREFLRELNIVLPEALDEMTKGSGDDRSPVAPVDLSQAIIGPGMAIFSKYAAVLESDGTSMSVRSALQLINRFLAEDDFDHDTQFCLHWFDQYGWAEGAFGEADVLARAKATSVDALAGSGVIRSGSGKVRLLRPDEYPTDWDPTKDLRVPIWEALHQLVRLFRRNGETGAGELLAGMNAKSEGIRQLAYRLYTLCERRGWADDARAYNELITSWTGIETAAAATTKPTQRGLFDRE